MTLDLRIQIPVGGALVRDFVAAGPASAPFFGARFDDGAAFARQAAAVDARFTDTMHGVWTSGVRAHGARAQARLEALRAGRGFVVTTGQQPGLFGGPLYSLYKAITAARLADVLEARLGRPVAPVFWVASEDHDWAEADHTWMIGVDNALHRIGLDEVPGAGRAPLFRLPMGPGIDAALEALAAQLPQTDFAPAVLRRLREICTPDATLPGAFESLLADLLEPLGVLFVQAHDPWLKQASVPVLEAELLAGPEHLPALAARSAALEAAGFGVQVPVLSDAPNLFIESAWGRERMHREGAAILLRHSGERHAVDAVRDRLHADPACFSPNVLLRPVVESAVLPTLAYVGGPGELAYFAQLSPLFAAHGIAMPIAFPRLGGWVVETKVAKVLDKFGLGIDALARPFHEIAAELARDEMPDAVRAALGRLRGSIGEGVGALDEAARAVDPTLKGPVQHVRSVAFDALGDVERKILQAVKRGNETTLQQIAKARLHLFPDERPQERVLNPLYHVARYGDEFVGALDGAFAHALPLGADVG